MYLVLWFCIFGRYQRQGKRSLFFFFFELRDMPRCNYYAITAHTNSQNLINFLVSIIPLGLDPKYLTTVIPYHIENGTPNIQQLQVLIKSKKVFFHIIVSRY